MIEAFLIFFTLLCSIQIYFHWDIFSRILSHKDDNEKVSSGVSIIIAARNEAKNLEHLVEALMKQNHSNYEVIIANDRSSDGSREILDKLGGVYKNIRLIHIETLPKGWTGKKNALKQGIELAKYDTLVFTDADCIPSSNDWITQMTLGNELIQIGFSPYESDNSWLSQFIKFETLLTGCQYLGFALKGKPYMAVGRNWSIQKSVYPLEFLEQIKGFEGGDDDLVLNHLSERIKIGVKVNKASQTISKPKKSWRAFFRQKVRHLSVGTRYHQKDQTLLGIFTLAHVVGWLMFLTALIIALKPYIILIIFGLRSLSFYTIFTLVGRKLGSKFALWALPVLDLCYSIYYPLAGISAWSAKKIEWS